MSFVYPTPASYSEAKTSMRYFLENQVDGQWHDANVKKKTRKDVDQWMEDNIKACGLDWRVGYQVKFRNSDHVYRWRYIRNGNILVP
jgi:hypothetical protein